MVLKKMDSHRQRNEMTHLKTYTKINSKWIKDLNIRPETIKLLEEYTGSKLPDISLGNEFLDLTPKAKATKPKIHNWEHIKLKSICSANDPVNKIKRQPKEREKISAVHTSDMG